MLHVFQNFKVLVEKATGYHILRFRCNNRKGEYDNYHFKAFLLQYGISYEPSAPYTQNQNGVSERMIRSINSITRSLLSDAQMLEGFWAEATQTSVYLKNRWPTRSLGSNQTPYEAFYSIKPSFYHLRRFGCNAYVYIHPNMRTK